MWRLSLEFKWIEALAMAQLWSSKNFESSERKSLSVLGVLSGQVVKVNLT